MLLNKLFHPSREANAAPLPYRGWRMGSIIVAGLILAATLASAWFLYQNAYLTLQHKNDIVILSAEPNLQPLDMARYNEFKAVLTLQHAATATTTAPSRNPFALSPGGAVAPNGL